MKTETKRPRMAVSTEARNNEIRGMNADTTNSVKRLRLQLLDEKGKIFSQPQLCVAIGLSANSYPRMSAYESGLKPPKSTIEKLEALAKERGIEWSYQ